MLCHVIIMWQNKVNEFTGYCTWFLLSTVIYQLFTLMEQWEASSNSILVINEGVPIYLFTVFKQGNERFLCTQRI